MMTTTTFANGHHEDAATTIIPSRSACLYCYNLRSHWKILMWGQVLSLLLASAGAAQATLHLSCGLSAPTFTMATIYFVLSFHLILVVWRTKKQRKLRDSGVDAIFHTAGDNEEEEVSNTQPELTNNEDEGNLSAVISNSTCTDEPSSSSRLEYSFFGLFPLYRPTWQYAIIAFLDVEANAITIMSFRYTTLTSVTLFDALAIPSAIFLSKYFLRRQYTWVHILGVVTCMAGVGFNVLQDYESDHEDSASNDEYPHKLRGDMFAITGGLLYGLNDVLAEVTIRQAGETTEYLGVMGLFAFVLSLIQALIFEWQDILEFFGRSSSGETCSPAMGWWLLFVFVGVTLMGYAGASRFLLVSEAAFFNLSLLTGDLWSVLFSIVAERIVPQPLFFVALVFVLSGVVLYEMAPSPVMEDRHAQVKAERLTQLEEDDNDLEPRERTSTSDDDKLL